MQTQLYSEMMKHGRISNDAAELASYSVDDEASNLWAAASTSITLPSQTVLDQAAPSQVQLTGTWPPRVCWCHSALGSLQGSPMESLWSWQKVAGMFAAIDHRHRFGPNSWGIFSRATLEVRLMVFAFSKRFFFCFFFSGNVSIWQRQRGFSADAGRALSSV